MTVCAWCDLPLAGLRADARYCSTRCRQAAWRFSKHVRAGARLQDVKRIAYADPPYLGKAAACYGDEPDFAGEVDHRELASHLEGFDGWALSCSERSLPLVLSFFPNDVRVAVWWRDSRADRNRCAGPRNVYEPVIYRCARPHPSVSSPDDVLRYVARPRTTERRQIKGMKPAAFWGWIFGLMGAAAGDEFHDLYPGTGAGARAWALFSEEPSLGAGERVAQDLHDA